MLGGNAAARDGGEGSAAGSPQWQLLVEGTGAAEFQGSEAAQLSVVEVGASLCRGRCLGCLRPMGWPDVLRTSLCAGPWVEARR